MMKVLTVNSGSSSVRMGLYEKTPNGLIRIGERHVKPDEGSPDDLLKHFLTKGLQNLDVVSHRIVHGGATLTESCIITGDIEQKIDDLSLLAPLHNPIALEWIRACRAFSDADIPQVAVFDTAFYADMPDVSKIYGLPQALCSKHGIRRYGFHGIAHKAMLNRLVQLNREIIEQGKVVSVQLGSGCSITATKNGTPIDTSMGFSPNEGLLMSTRSGDIDSGILVYLQDRMGISATEIDRVLNKSSGLLGVSGLSGDMKTLLASDNPQAALAIELYCYRVRKYIGAYIAVLGGLDCILFGGGVGENAPLVRGKILENIEWCGIEFDDNSNAEAVSREGMISSDSSRVKVMVIPVDEAAVLAEEALGIVE